MSNTEDEFEIGGEVERFPTVKLAEEGDTVEGVITKRERTQQYSYVDEDDRASGVQSEPLFWNKSGKMVTDDTGNPVMQTVLTLKVNDDEAPLQRLFVKGRLFSAFKEYADETGKPVRFEVGATIKVRRGPGQMKKLQYKVKVTPPDDIPTSAPEKAATVDKKEKAEVPF